MLSVSAEEKLDKIAMRLAQWHQDYFHDNQDIQRRRKEAERKGAEKLKKFEEGLPARLKDKQGMREKAGRGLSDIMTCINQMKELTDMVLPQHKVVVPVPLKEPELKTASPKNKSVKKERCPNGTKKTLRQENANQSKKLNIFVFIHKKINTEMRKKRCSGGQPNCKNYVGDYIDVDDAGCCKACDDYIDENPYDPYWEQMEQAFGDSPEYEEAEKSGLLEHVGGYEKAFEKFQETYEPWPIMRRRMAKKNK